MPRGDRNATDRSRGYNANTLIDGRGDALDGVAIMGRGDLFLVVYGAAARLHRTRWLFDRADELARNHASVIVLMVVLPAADPPDGPTRAENATRLKALGFEGNVTPR